MGHAGGDDISNPFCSSVHLPSWLPLAGMLLLPFTWTHSSNPAPSSYPLAQKGLKTSLLDYCAHAYLRMCVRACVSPAQRFCVYRHPFFMRFLEIKLRSSCLYSKPSPWLPDHFSVTSNSWFRQTLSSLKTQGEELSPSPVFTVKPSSGQSLWRETFGACIPIPHF